MIRYSTTPFTQRRLLAFRHAPALALTAALLSACMPADKRLASETTEPATAPGDAQAALNDAARPGAPLAAQPQLQPQPSRQPSPQPGPEPQAPAGQALLKQHKGEARADLSQAAPPHALELHPQRLSESTTPRRYTAPLSYSEPPALPANRERFAQFTDNQARAAALEPLSTFGLDVDTASYTVARSDLNRGHLPTPAAVRVEEWLNYFDYAYPAPRTAEHPLALHTEVAPSPWAQGRHLLRIGLKGYEVSREQLPPLNLTFLIDVSGSMAAPNKLPLAKSALRLLVRQLRPQDRVALVVYAGAAGLVLDATPGNHQDTILGALEHLQAGGSTAGGAGIQLAYHTARKNRAPGTLSRVILLSDGDFNVGTTSTETLKQLVARERDSGVSLSVLTFGRGNLRDELANALAETGNGNAAYIDSAQEAQKALVDQMSGTLMTIAQDVKLQVEMNPDWVAEYRLLGYETRHLANQDFDNDRKDAGELGAGHQVTALYELTLKGSPATLRPRLRYEPVSQEPATFAPPRATELAYLKLRYKQPGGHRSTLISTPIQVAEIRPSLAAASADFRWAAAVAGAAQRARGSALIGPWRYADSLALARSALGTMGDSHRQEFLRLMALAEALDAPATARLDAPGWRD